MTSEANSEALELERYLHLHIPISAAMGVRVAVASREVVQLTAPLEPNINHRRTVFGGSAAAVGILAGWALLHVRLGHGGTVSRIVIQRGAIDYDLPIEGDFEAVAAAPSPDVWERFTRTVARRGRGRIDLDVELVCAGTSVGRSRGAYVVLPLDTEPQVAPSGSA